VDFYKTSSVEYEQLTQYKLVLSVQV